MEFMNSVPLEVWAGLLGVAIGSALSLFGTWLNSKSNLNQLRIRLRHQQQANETELLKSRLEELYTLVGGLGKFYGRKIPERCNGHAREADVQPTLRPIYKR